MSSVMVVVQTFSGGQLSYLQSLSDSLEDVYVISRSDAVKSRLIVEIPAGELGRVLPVFANAKEVEWVEPFVLPTLNNDIMHWQVQSGQAGENPLWDRGVTGEGQVVGVGDTGLDADMVFFWDYAQGLPTSLVNHNQRKVISYHDLAGTGDWGGHDHGTHVAGTIAGKSTGVNDQYNGVAYDAKLVIPDRYR